MMLSQNFLRSLDRMHSKVAYDYVTAPDYSNDDTVSSDLKPKVKALINRRQVSFLMSITCVKPISTWSVKIFGNPVFSLTAVC